MEMVPISYERMAQLAEFAHRRGQGTTEALDVVLPEYLTWEQRDFQEAVEGIREGYADSKAGRTRDAAEAFEQLREKHGLPR